MSLPITFSFQCSIRRNGKSSLATDGQPLQFVQLRLRHFGQLVHTPSQQILQQTSPTLISDTLIPFSLWELEDPPFISYFFLFRFLSSYDISAAVCDAIFYNISSFAGQILLAADSNINVNFHIIADVDIVYTHWVDLDPAEDAPAVRKGASTSVIERVMKEKYDGNGGEEKEGDDQCSVCYEQLRELEE
ncbi:hypothetical protein Csa_012785 [Cucumis sativus]|nr:hypothetical protein Csa_012785 [Cucumis sativus]